MIPGPATADRISAVVFFALGAAMLVGGYTMDRLEIRQIHPASIPGLVPMILGAALMICAVLLFLGARRSPGEVAPAATGSIRAMATAALLSVLYAVGLVGRVPFEVATALYVTVFMAVFSWPAGTGVMGKAKAVAIAAGFGVVVSFAVSTLFRVGFLVRLP